MRPRGTVNVRGKNTRHLQQTSNHVPHSISLRVSFTSSQRQTGCDRYSSRIQKLVGGTHNTLFPQSAAPYRLVIEETTFEHRECGEITHCVVNNSSALESVTTIGTPPSGRRGDRSQRGSGGHVLCVCVSSHTPKLVAPCGEI